jgi:hypothetical protein
MLHTIESDIDLHEPRGKARGGSQALSSAALSGLDATGAITPAMLAKHHLPDILLTSGPLAIRYVLGDLTQTVPGFSRIPPTKARRIVVSALENRAGGGVDGEVVFEKVGWGRWDARLRGQPPKEGRNAPPGSLQDAAQIAASPPASLPGSYAMSSGGLHIPGVQNTLGRRVVSGASWTGSTLSSRDDDMDHVSEHEADKMSLDGDDQVATRTVPKINHPADDEEMTDEEDWERVGPEGLLNTSAVASYAGSLASRRGSHISSRGRNSRAIPARAASTISQRSQKRNPSFAAFSPTAIRSMSYSGGIMPFQRVYSSSLSSSLRMQGVSVPNHCGSPQEREAVEALLNMGSM